MKPETQEAPRIIAPISGHPLKIGSGFTAISFREADFTGAMDPLVMVDHYRMKESTFGAHPHAGLSAVSILFEDSSGKFHNRDSLGNSIDLSPGDLYWLKAGSGAVHDEAPREGARIHGLQVFVNLPARTKRDTPDSLHVKATDVPVLETDDYRVRIVLGESNSVSGATSPAQPMTILDGQLRADSAFTHVTGSGENVWVYAIEGDLDLTIESGHSTQEVRLKAGESIAIEASRSADLSNSYLHDSDLRDGGNTSIRLRSGTSSGAHFALFSATPLNEAFVQKGPFVMNNKAEITEVEARYAGVNLYSMI